MDMLTTLRALNLDRIDIDEMVALKTFGESMRGTYEVQGLATPEWLSDTLDVLGKEIASKRIEQLTRERKLIEAQERTLMTKEEKRAELAQRKAAIDKQLGLGVPATAPTTTGVPQP